MYVPGTRNKPPYHQENIIYPPIVTSKVIGLSPIFLSIMVASKKDPNKKNSSTFPVEN